MKILSRRAIILLPWRLVFLFGVLTGCGMTAAGLAARLTNAVPSDFLEAWFGTAFFDAIGIDAARIGWMLVLEGTFWIAALSALGVHNYWGWWSTIAAGLISMIFFPGGTLAGSVVLTAVGIRLLRARFRKRPGKTTEAQKP
jgi:hypothetical protein